MHPPPLERPNPIPFLINPGCVAGSCVVVAGHKETLYGTSSLSRVTVCVRNNAEESSISSEARVWGTGGFAVWARGGSAFGQLRHALSDGVRPL